MRNYEPNSNNRFPILHYCVLFLLVRCCDHIRTDGNDLLRLISAEPRLELYFDKLVHEAREMLNVG